jgi:ankyrin repeat protein
MLSDFEVKNVPLSFHSTMDLLFRLLIKQGSKVSDKDIEGNTPLHLAAESGNRPDNPFRYQTEAELYF